MIHTSRTVTVGKMESVINEPIMLYRGDREVEIEFNIVGSKFMFSNGGNVIKSTNATNGQLVINTPTGENMFSEVTECNDGKVICVITKEMIDELAEVGFYSFQIRLFDESQVSRVTIPPVYQGIEIRNPIAAEDETDLVDIGLVDFSVVRKDNYENVVTFLPNGDYNKTLWEEHDVISKDRLNKVEDALYEINKGTEGLYPTFQNQYDEFSAKVNKDVKAYKEEMEDEVEQFERDMTQAFGEFKVDYKDEVHDRLDVVEGELEEVNEQLTHNMNLLKDVYVNVKSFGAIGDGITDDTEAFILALQTSNNIYIPQGNFNLKAWVTETINFDNIKITGAGVGKSLVILNETSFIKLRSKCIYIKDIEFCNSDILFDLVNDTEKDSIVLNNIKCDNCNTLIWWEYSNNTTNRVKNIIIENCEFIDRTRNKNDLIPIYLGGKYIEFTTIRNNIFSNLEATQGACIAIKVGERITQGEPLFTRENIKIVGNKINSVYSNSPSLKETQAILAYAGNIIIENNYISEIDAQVKDDTEGIRLNCNNYIVRNNILKNAGGFEGSITAKASGRNNIISGNIVIFDNRSSSTGICVHNSDTSICDNVIEGCSENGIFVPSTGTYNNLKINNNKISNCNATAGIMIRTDGSNVEINGNIIDNLTNESDITSAIYYNIPSNMVNNAKNIIISANIINNIEFGRGITVTGVSSPKELSEMLISNNIISDCKYSIRNTKTILRSMISQNIIRNCTNNIYIDPSSDVEMFNNKNV